MSNNVACLNMIKQQLRTNNIHNESILSLFSQAERSKFAPEAFQSFAFADMQIPLAHHQFMMTPLEEAQILETAKLKPNDYVLEIGTGSGHLTYLLSQFCEKVVSIDIHENFIQNAKQHFQDRNIQNVEFIHQDASVWSSATHLFDVIICTAAIEAIPADWLKMLKANGKIFAPIGDKAQNAQWIYLNNKKMTGHEFVFHTHLPKLLEAQHQEKFIF